jgi:hypothetical protein
MSGEDTSEEKREDESTCRESCPVGKFLSTFGRCFDPESEVRKHLVQSRIEFLKAIKSMVDESIADLEKDISKRKPKKATKIEVE